MSYVIYFDESNKLDQPGIDYSYYGALGMDETVANNIRQYINNLNETLRSKSEMHFVEYTQDTNFEKYFKALHYVLSQPIQLNLMIVNKGDAEKLTTAMDIKMAELRELFYVKIPERLFYGLTRDLSTGQHIKIVIDENSEYEKIELEKKIIEQMNAHSAYRKKAYKVVDVEQASSEKDLLLQMIDNLMGIIVFVLEKQHKAFEENRDNITLDVKCDLIYRLLIEQNNLELLHKKVMLYCWEGNEEGISQIEFSQFTGNFIMSKTKYDVSEMAKLAQVRAMYPNETTKFYRVQMGYPRQLRKLLGYIDELDGKGRNSYYLEK
ncbi:DUF3800 domain-containing protein [Lysinibacillus sp. BW-2-10]|uniref:DUF3800 domain-containing protein n=1 Tax=Lysinibacillus sp. BW-2-10 TaxID=2590030 RepID=UPI00117FCFAA|nr:DUF3800 domain-containing protein [Lysinibacillus sp. BW-2-10]TSI05289.1 hypothetical protein FJQ64_13370 [Lysinibacillus sp. BW-2-10]